MTENIFQRFVLDFWLFSLIQATYQPTLVESLITTYVKKTGLSYFKNSLIFYFRPLSEVLGGGRERLKIRENSSDPPFHISSDFDFRL